MSRLVRNHQENKSYMKMLCRIRDRMERNLEKRGDPTMNDRVRIVGVLVEELGEISRLALDLTGRNSPNHEVPTYARFDEEMIDLVAYGLTVLVRQQQIDDENERTPYEDEEHKRNSAKA